MPSEIHKLSRDYRFYDLEDINVSAEDLSEPRAAFTALETEPEEEDWHSDPVFVIGSNSDLYRSDYGTQVAVLIGDSRGDDVDTVELEAGDYQVWIEVKAGDERPVRRPEVLEVYSYGS